MWHISVGEFSLFSKMNQIYFFIVSWFYPRSSQWTTVVSRGAGWWHVAWWWQVNHRKSVNMSVEAPRLADNWTQSVVPRMIKRHTSSRSANTPSTPPPQFSAQPELHDKKANPPTAGGVSSAILQLPSSPCYLWRSRRGHWANLVFIVQLAPSRNASPPPPTQFSINVSAPPYMSSSPVSPFMAIGGQQGFEILPGRVILNANSRIRIACVWCTQASGSAAR